MDAAPDRWAGVPAREPADDRDLRRRLGFSTTAAARSGAGSTAPWPKSAHTERIVSPGATRISSRIVEDRGLPCGPRVSPEQRSALTLRSRASAPMHAGRRWHRLTLAPAAPMRILALSTTPWWGFHGGVAREF
jgi:hypothetical protein